MAFKSPNEQVVLHISKQASDQISNSKSVNTSPIHVICYITVRQSCTQYILRSTQSTMLQFGRSLAYYNVTQPARLGFQKPFQLQFAHIMQHGHRIIDQIFFCHPVVFVSLYQEHENATLYSSCYLPFCLLLSLLNHLSALPSENYLKMMHTSQN